jgi:sporulation protein YtfJ
MGLEQHPIEGLMKTAMESIQEMVDVSTVVGDPVEVPDGTVVIPISRVALGFAAGGGEFEVNKGENESAYPFGGGSGAGVSVQPVGFLVIAEGQVRLLPVDSDAIAGRLVDLAPQVLEKIDAYFQRSGRKKL